MRKLIPGLAVLAAAVAFSVWAYPHLPLRVATHFDIHGTPNGWSSRLWAVALMPAIVLGLAAMFAVLPQIDPRRANYAKFGSTYWTIANATLILTSLIQVVVLGKALGWAFDATRVAFAAVGLVLALIGNLMTRVRPNWFVGIRTPWTLSSDTVWRKTHRFGGFAFVVAGLIMAFAALLAGAPALVWALAVVGAAALASVVYSYLVWRGEQESKP
jgi:immunity protein, SdpI family